MLTNFVQLFRHQMTALVEHVHRGLIYWHGKCEPALPVVVGEILINIYLHLHILCAAEGKQ